MKITYDEEQPVSNNADLTQSQLYSRYNQSIGQIRQLEFGIRTDMRRLATEEARRDELKQEIERRKSLNIEPSYEPMPKAARTFVRQRTTHGA